MSKLPYPSIGQRVVCICDNWRSSFDVRGQRRPKKGEVFTLKDVTEHEAHIWVRLVELCVTDHHGNESWYHKDNFKPVADTDISDLLALQNPTPDQIEALRRHDAQRWSVPVKETT